MVVKTLFFTFLLALACSHQGEMKEQPILISVQEVKGEDIRFTTVLPPSFGGHVTGELTGKMNKCFAHEQSLGKLENGSEVRTIQLTCGKAIITVEGIGFQ